MLCYFSATSQAEFLIYQSFCVSLYNMLQLNLIFFYVKVKALQTSLLFWYLII